MTDKEGTPCLVLWG